MFYDSFKRLCSRKLLSIKAPLSTSLGAGTISFRLKEKKKDMNYMFARYLAAAKKAIYDGICLNRYTSSLNKTLQIMSLSLDNNVLVRSVFMNKKIISSA